MTATLVEWLARSAERHPDRDAIVAGRDRMTFADLWRAVQCGAASLADRGIGRGDRVALLAAATPDAAAAWYAVMAAGAAVVPLDPGATAFELATRVAHCEPRLVVTAGPAGAGTIASGTVPRVRASGLIAHPAPRADRAAPDPSDLAAILYTSGTTDQPKGVMLTHENLASNALAVIEYLRLGPDDRVLSPLPLFYAYGSSVLHTHLASGASVVLGDMVYAERTVEIMAAERVTGFSGVPWMFTTLMDRTSFPTRELPALRYLTQAGSRMPPADLERVTRARPDVEFFVMYGQTEATSRLTYLPPAALADRPASVGRPIAGARLEVWRADGSRAAASESGDVVAAGPGIMAGYWRAPAATAEAIVTNDRGRWLRTGDRGYLDADGFLFLDGRASDLIKVGAHRVSPAEIEEVARLLPEVTHAAAVAAPDPLLGEVVHLVVVRKAGSRLTAAEIVTHCRGHLSLYKLPRQVTFTDALPHTASGKLQRARLARELQTQS